MHHLLIAQNSVLEKIFVTVTPFYERVLRKVGYTFSYGYGGRSRNSFSYNNPRE